MAVSQKDWFSRSVWESLDLGRVYRPYYVRSVLTTSHKILPYRPPARLIRAKYELVLWNHICPEKFRMTVFKQSQRVC